MTWEELKTCQIELPPLPTLKSPEHYFIGIRAFYTLDGAPEYDPYGLWWAWRWL